ncbi:helix-turn-helix transcriptional regulator [Nakamurella lactea]|uniref:helix-turn-helix transcriptional regulator n=1 Tax=Nakamurella lactea TaxID=459515 RepID=UPI00040E1358
MPLSVGHEMMDDVSQSVFQTPLIGRADELAELRRLVGVDEELAAGAVLLGGDAGVGKTRILAELRDAAVVQGRRAMVGHCVDFGDTAPPYLPFAEMFARLATEDPDAAAQLAQRHPAVARLAFRSSDGAAPIDRGALVDDVHSALSELAQDRPVLVIIEDAHWADRSTQDMISLLFTRGFDVPVSVVVSYRTDDLHRRHPLRQALIQWGRLSGVHRVALPPLADDDVEELVQSLHPAPLAAATVHGIVARAEGNAFFAEELVGAAEAGLGRVPDDLAGLMLIRLDSLDDASRDVVRAASVSGRRVTHALLAAVCGLTDSELEAAVRGAVERNVLVPARDGYSFRHALLAESVYDDLLPGERTRLHAAYVAVLKESADAGSSAELARHARAAQDIETAVRAGIRAAGEAADVGGPDQAAKHYEHAIEQLNRLPDLAAEFDRTSLVSQWVDALTAAGQSMRALTVAKQLVADVPPEAPSAERVRAVVVLAEAALLEDSWLALETAKDGLALMPEQLTIESIENGHPGVVRARLLSVLAHASLANRDLDRTVEAAGEALDLGERLGLTGLVADVTTTLARLKEYAGDPQSSAQSLAEIIATAHQRGHITAEIRGHHQLGGVYLGEGDLPMALASYRAGAEQAAAAGRPWAPYGIDSRMLGAITAYMSGDWAIADELVDLAGTNPPGLAEAGLSSVGLLLAAGRGQAAALNRLPVIRKRWGFDGLITVTAGFACIDLYGDSGDLPSAVAIHDEVVAQLDTMWGHHGYLALIRLSALLIGQFGTAAAAAGQQDREVFHRRGLELIETAREVLAQNVGRGIPVGPEAHAWAARIEAEFARLSWIAGIDPPAQDVLTGLWQQAVEHFARLGWTFEEARSRARWAAALGATGSGQAGDVVAPALETALALGAGPLLTELRALGNGTARKPPGRGRRGAAASTRADDDLTPRESEILALVALGRSNGEIGKRLFISTKTVSVHVSNILAKLGAGGRTEAAAIGRERGLV